MRLRNVLNPPTVTGALALFAAMAANQEFFDSLKLAAGELF